MEAIAEEKVISEKTKFIAKTYGWMALALVISGVVAFFTATSEPILRIVFGYNGKVIMGLCILEIVLVFVLSINLRKLPAGAVAVLFLVYSVLNGLTLSSIFCVYGFETIAFNFGAAALMFGIMSLYGIFTKRNLATVGKYLVMFLVGLIVISLINLLLSKVLGYNLSAVDWIISVLFIIVFMGITAYDTQKIMNASKYANEEQEEIYKKLSVYGALQLYLDFINIFLRLLRLTGRRR